MTVRKTSGSMNLGTFIESNLIGLDSYQYLKQKPNNSIEGESKELP